MTIVKRRTLFIGLAGLLILVFLYRYSPYKIQFLGHYDKIWAHRVNSIDKLKSATHFFQGVELDLDYDTNEDFLEVNHPPAKSIGLDFKDYLAQMDSDLKPYLWLDIKNLNIENGSQIYKKLVKTFKAVHYPIQKVLIETQHPEALPIFEDYGFMTSYYLPPELYLKDSISLKAEIINIHQILIERPNMGISTDYKDYEIIKTYFPKKTKYIWILVSSFNTEFSKISNILNDETVKVVLVNYKTIKGNR